MRATGKKTNSMGLELRHGQMVRGTKESIKRERSTGKGNCTSRTGACKGASCDAGRYEGEFKVNEISGKGVYRWNDGKVYEGHWENNKMHGEGFLKWPDGKEYRGQFMDDKRHGAGAFVWKDGRKYKGNWYMGKQHGRGTFVGADNVEKKGEWAHGKRIKWLQDDDH